MSKSHLLHRIGGAIVVSIGIGIALLTMTNDLFDRAPDYEALVDDMRPLFSDEGIATLRSDLDGLDAAGAEFADVVVPTIAGATDESVGDTQAFLSEQFPDVVTGLSAIPELTAQFRGLADLIESQMTNFESADAIPTSSSTASAIPWLLTGISVLFLAGGLTLFFLHTPTAGIIAGSLGVVVLLLLVTLGLPGKASDADELNSSVGVVFDPATVDTANRGLAAVGAMAEQLGMQALPAIGEILEIPTDQLDAVVADKFPDTAAALNELPEASVRFGGLVQLIDANRARYDNIRPVDFSRVILLALIGSVLVTSISLATVAAQRRRASADSAVLGSLTEATA
jgi:hypothetical protein